LEAVNLLVFLVEALQELFTEGVGHGVKDAVQL
jgi:hypothetical protein